MIMKSFYLTSLNNIHVSRSTKPLPGDCVDIYGWGEVLGNTNVTVAEKDVFYKIKKKS